MSRQVSEAKIRELLHDALLYELVQEMHPEVAQIDQNALSGEKFNKLRETIDSRVDALFEDYRTSLVRDDIKKLIVEDVRKELTATSKTERILSSVLFLSQFCLALLLGLVTSLLQLDAGSVSATYVFSVIRPVVYVAFALLVVSMVFTFVLRTRF